MAIAETVTSATVSGFASILSRLVSDFAARSLSTDRSDKIKTNIQPHIEATYKKCTQIKTLLNPNEPVEFLSIYATQRFAREDESFDQYSLVEWIRTDGYNAIITGTGGSGKSMFMRYLWLSMFVHSDGRVPIFAELRGMNSASKLNLEQYLFYVLSGGRGSITQKDFKRSLSRGEFVIILDGFDELSSERRSEVQDSLMDLAVHYPQLKIIVSSRPDDEFQSWTSFSVVRVAPLKKADAEELVTKAPFDETSKEKFCKKIQEPDFYSRQKSFLENPLLVSMMLLTFSYSYDIPERTHLFYRQAFDALYQRHDRHKPGGYRRHMNAQLSEDQFIRLLSYFCLLTYYEQRFEFDRDQLISFIAKASSVESIDVAPEDFLKDLVECVCLIVKDGFVYSFAHRSFQEYFAAYCISYVTAKNIDVILDRFSERYNDQVIPLISDMNPEVFREKFVLRLAERYESELQLKRRSRSVSKFCDMIDAQFYISGRNLAVNEISLVIEKNKNIYDFAVIVNKISSLPRDSIKSARDRALKDSEVAMHIMSVAGPEVSSVTVLGGEKFKFFANHPDGRVEEINDDGGDLNNAFAKTRMYEYFFIMLRNVSSYISDARKSAGNSTNAMMELFGSGQ